MITPLPEMGKVAYMNECIEDAVAKGAKVLNAGGGTSVETMFYPAVLFPVTEGMKLYREEQFGPVVPVAPSRTSRRPLQYVITSDHGQQVSVFGKDPDLIARLVDPLSEPGRPRQHQLPVPAKPRRVPLRRAQGFGRGTLSVHDALRSFSIRTMVAAKQTEATKKLLDEIVLGNKSNFLNTRFIL